MIRISVKNGVATIQSNIHAIYKGTTADSPFMSKNGKVPFSGKMLDGFTIAPELSDFGTLVFDYAHPKLRTPISPIFLQFRWRMHKLVVNRGLKNLSREFTLSPDFGLAHLIWENPPDCPAFCYSTHEGLEFHPAHCKLVDLLPLLEFLEGKISRVELDKRSIP